MSREYTKDEVLELFLGQCRVASYYWAEHAKVDSRKEAVEGMLHSMLCIIDGVSGGFPAINLSVDPDPSDKQYHIDNEEDYYPSGLVFNDDVMLHELTFGRK